LIPLQTVDCHGIGGFAKVEKVVAHLMSLLSVCRAEQRRQLTNEEADGLDAIIQELNVQDCQSAFSKRGKKAKETGRFKKKKGEGDREFETCAK
jgi:hypothetical protein